MQRAAVEHAQLQAAIAAADRQVVARLVVSGCSTHIRQEAARAVEDPQQLRELIRQVRGGKDNNVYRILTAKRDELLARSRVTEQVQAEITTVIVALERHTHRPYDALFAPTLAQLEKRWQAICGNAAAAESAAAAQNAQRCHEIIEQHEREHAQLEARQSAQLSAAAAERERREAEASAAAAAAAERQRLLAEQRQAAEEAETARLTALREIAALLRQAQAALNAGRTRRAADLRATLSERLQSAPVLPPRLANQLQQLDERLQEVKDWKSFSVAPKRTQLLSEMQLLVDAQLEPALLAERITGLRQQWRTLNRGAADEGVPAEEQLFQDAAEKAYQPCRAYFAAQALLRKENLERRGALVARLQAFRDAHDWQQPDWNLVSTALRESQQLWRAASPAEKAGSGPVVQQFQQLTADLQGRLDAEQARNTERKRRLIEQARGLLAREDSREAIEMARALQQQWRQIGPVPRATDHELWDEFRQQCDAIFQRRQQEFAEYTAALEQNRMTALAVCAELEALVQMPAEQLLLQSDRVAELSGRFEAAGELPRPVSRGLHQRFERALQRCEQARERARREQTEQGWLNVLSAAQQLQALRRAQAGGAAAEEQLQLRHETDALLTSATSWPAGFLQMLRAELDRAPTGSDVQANERALRELCIRAEILTDTATPPEDLPLRRTYQMQRLVQGMGQRLHADPHELDRIVLDWVRIGPVAEQAYQPLLERLRQCRRIAMAMPERQ